MFHSTTISQTDSQPHDTISKTLDKPIKIPHTDMLPTYIVLINNHDITELPDKPPSPNYQINHAQAYIVENLHDTPFPTRTTKLPLHITGLSPILTKMSLKRHLEEEESEHTQSKRMKLNFEQHDSNNK